MFRALAFLENLCLFLLVSHRYPTEAAHYSEYCVSDDTDRTEGNW